MPVTVVNALRRNSHALMSFPDLLENRVQSVSSASSERADANLCISEAITLRKYRRQQNTSAADDDEVGQELVPLDGEWEENKLKTADTRL